jgi:Phosphoesterase family
MTGRHSDLRDLEHVVILMQENRSFDHYFGSLRGFAGSVTGPRSRCPAAGPQLQRPGPRPRHLPGRSDRDQPGLVRPDGHGGQRPVLVAALRRPPGERPARRHRLAGAGGRAFAPLN